LTKFIRRRLRLSSLVGRIALAASARSGATPSDFADGTVPGLVDEH
jgi:hypothetical protein